MVSVEMLSGMGTLSVVETFSVLGHASRQENALAHDIDLAYKYHDVAENQDHHRPSHFPPLPTRLCAIRHRFGCCVDIYVSQSRYICDNLATVPTITQQIIAKCRMPLTSKLTCLPNVHQV